MQLALCGTAHLRTWQARLLTHLPFHILLIVAITRAFSFGDDCTGPTLGDKLACTAFSSARIKQLTSLGLTPSLEVAL